MEPVIYAVMLPARSSKLLDDQGIDHMRVLLIYPALDSPAGINHGIISLSAVLKQGGHEVQLIFANEEVGPIPTVEEIAETVRRYGPGLIGYSCMSQQYDWAVGVNAYLKKEFPEIPSVVGGVHVTMVPDEVVDQNHFDFACAGEGEYALLELVNRIERGEDTTTVPNMRMIRDGKKIVNPVGPFPDLNTLPRLDYELFDVEHVTKVKNGWLGMLTSRGCPYQCTYCFNKEIVDLYIEEGGAKKSKDFLRHFPLDTVMADLKDLTSKYPCIEMIIFDDDLFTLNKSYVLDFCEAYGAAIGLPFVVNAHVQVFGEEMAKALKAAGCRIVKYGLESGNPRIRKDVLRRPMTNEQILRSFQAAHKFDLHTSAFLMFGLPFEGREEIMDTIRLCAATEMGRFRWAIFFPFPGTAAYTISKQNNLIDWEKMKGMGNYFDASCLTFDAEHDLFIEKLGKIFHWYVNAETAWQSAPIYRELVETVEPWDRQTWESKLDWVDSKDRELSDELMDKDILHYSKRYSSVMGVRSDFVKWERSQAKKGPKTGADYTLDD